MFAAYEKYAIRFGLNVSLLDWDEGHIVAKISGDNAGRYFRYESGKHVVQRVPPTEHNGRKQTSVIVVAILPLPPEQKMKPLPPNELDTITQTGKQRAGGQNANKVASAVRMKHIPTGIQVFINGRDQVHNRREALKILTARVNDYYQNKEQSVYVKMRKELMDGNRGNKIRTYNLLENRVVDHRFNKKVSNPDIVLKKGQFELLINT